MGGSGLPRHPAPQQPSWSAGYVDVVENHDELRALPDDDFPGKNQLNLEADSLRRQLAADPEHDSEAIMAGWPERSGRKGAHTVDDDEELAKADIVSPGQSGH